MHMYTLTHLTDAALLRDLTALVARDRATTAELLAHIAEVDTRKLYREAGYSSMFAYCVGELHLSEDMAYRRITAARAARVFPVLFDAVVEGRLHLVAVSLLAPHLTPENIDELIVAATYRSKSDVEELLARRFAVRDVPVKLRALPTIAVKFCDRTTTCEQELVPERADTGAGYVSMFAESEAEQAETSPTVEVSPAFAERFLLQLTMAKSTHDKLRYAQALLSHAVPVGDVAQLLDRALDALIAQLEKLKLGAEERRAGGPPTSPHPASPVSRYIPASVRRAVWERDEGRCTFVSITGGRCRSRRFIELDHVVPFARGGKATVENLRLRCSAHNQYEAERVFGVDFMRQKHEGRVASAAREGATDAGAVAGEGGP